MANATSKNRKPASPKSSRKTAAKSSEAARPKVVAKSKPTVKPAVAASGKPKVAAKSSASPNPKASTPIAVPDPTKYPPELTKAIESFGHMAGYYVQCLPGDPDEKTQQVAGVVSGLQRILLASGDCPAGWTHCPNGSCVPPDGVCP